MKDKTKLKTHRIQVLLTDEQWINLNKYKSVVDVDMSDAHIVRILVDKALKDLLK